VSDKFKNAIRLFDEANAKDPNSEILEGKAYPKELIYSIRMSDKLNDFNINASEDVKLAARCQHICRWEIPRDTFEMNRNGYLAWRRQLAIFHAEKASEILELVGYDQQTIKNVSFLLQKKQLKRNVETQLLEDVICLVFLEYYFENFSEKYSNEKLMDIIRKTWAKMSDKGHEFALALDLSTHSKELISRALS